MSAQTNDAPALIAASETTLRSIKGQDHVTRVNANRTRLANLDDLPSLTCQLFAAGTALTTLQGLNAQLRMLDISNTAIADLKPLSACASLTSLNCANSAVTSLEPLRSMRLLQRLDFSGCAVALLTPILELYELTFLDCSNSAVTDLSLTPNFKLTEFRCISCNITDLGDVVYESDRLTWLDISRTGITVTNSMLESLAKTLVTLNADGCAVICIGIEVYAKADNIGKKYSNFCRVRNPTDLAHYRANASTYQWPSEYDTNPFLFEVFKEYPSRPTQSMFTSRIIQIVASKPNLKTVSLRGTKITGLGLICDLELTDLDLSKCDIDSLPEFRRPELLRSLNISSTNIKKLSVEHMLNLKELDASSTPISSLGPCTRLLELRTVNVSFTHVTSTAGLNNAVKLEKFTAEGCASVDMSWLPKVTAKPRVQPSQPRVQPSQPRVQPKQPRVQPTQPHAQPTQKLEQPPSSAEAPTDMVQQIFKLCLATNARVVNIGAKIAALHVAAIGAGSVAGHEKRKSARPRKETTRSCRRKYVTADALDARRSVAHAYRKASKYMQELSSDTSSAYDTCDTSDSSNDCGNAGDFGNE